MIQAVRRDLKEEQDSAGQTVLYNPIFKLQQEFGFLDTRGKGVKHFTAVRKVTQTALRNQFDNIYFRIDAFVIIPHQSKGIHKLCTITICMINKG